MKRSNVIPFKPKKRAKRSGAWALRRSGSGIVILLPDLELADTSVDAARFAGELIVEALERGLTVEQLLELARALRGAK